MGLTLAEDKRGFYVLSCEQYDTSLHLLGKCRALVGKQRKHSGKRLLVPSELRQEHWSSLLKIAENAKRFKLPKGLHGDVHWAQQRP